MTTKPISIQHKKKKHELQSPFNHNKILWNEIRVQFFVAKEQSQKKRSHVNKARPTISIIEFFNILSIKWFCFVCIIFRINVDQFDFFSSSVGDANFEVQSAEWRGHLPGGGNYRHMENAKKKVTNEYFELTFSSVIDSIIMRICRNNIILYWIKTWFYIRFCFPLISIHFCCYCWNIIFFSSEKRAQFPKSGSFIFCGETKAICFLWVRVNTEHFYSCRKHLFVVVTFVMKLIFKCEINQMEKGPQMKTMHLVVLCNAINEKTRTYFRKLRSFPSILFESEKLCAVCDVIRRQFNRVNWILTISFPTINGTRFQCQSIFITQTD